MSRNKLLIKKKWLKSKIIQFEPKIVSEYSKLFFFLIIILLSMFYRPINTYSEKSSLEQVVWKGISAQIQEVIQDTQLSFFGAT